MAGDFQVWERFLVAAVSPASVHCSPGQPCLCHGSALPQDTGRAVKEDHHTYLRGLADFTGHKLTPKKLHGQHKLLCQCHSRLQGTVKRVLLEDDSSVDVLQWMTTTNVQKRKSGENWKEFLRVALLSVITRYPSLGGHPPHDSTQAQC